MLWRSISLLAASALLSCQEEPAPLPPEPPAPPAAPEPAPRPPLPPVPPDLGAVTRFDGDCTKEVGYLRADIGYDPGPPREPLEESAHDSLIYIPANSLGFVRVRAQAVFPADDPVNVLGTLADERWVRALGPVKNTDWSQGLGYVILAEDPEGRRCKGYISATVVEPLKPMYPSPNADPGPAAPGAATAP